uniref:Uncharacterized protein n=1 Tax=Solanum tuberosum TaxID=4113 RepID=M1DV23_SOLTU
MSTKIPQVLSFSARNKILLPNPKMLLYHLRKGEIVAKMEKGKDVEMKTTEESLRMKLRRLKQEIREMGERRIEVELATAAAQAKCAALDAELASMMARYAIVNEETLLCGRNMMPSTML